MSVQTLPQTGTWVVDPTHSQIEITARHLMVSKVRGTFKDFSGTINVADTPEDSSVEVTIEAGSIDTGTVDRDAHLRSPDFLDAESFPTITFRSTNIERDGSKYNLTGDLTIKGVTKPVTLEMDYLGVTADPWGNEKAAFTAEGTFNREDWGLNWNVALEAGGWLVSKTFDIEITVQAARA